MKRAWAITQLVVVWLVIGFVAFGLYGAWSTVARTYGSSKDFWDVSTAIGTCAAVVVALYTASASDRKQARDQLRLGRLTAAAMTFRLGLAIAAVRTARDRAKSGLRIDLDPGHFVTIADGLNDVRVGTDDEIRAMIALPDNCADNLAGAIDRLKVADAFFRKEAANPESDTKSRRSTLKTICALLEEAHDLLVSAGEVCERETTQFRAGLERWRLANPLTQATEEKTSTHEPEA